MMSKELQKVGAEKVRRFLREVTGLWYMNDTRQQRQRKAKAAKRDEFYTQYSDIENELKFHKSSLKGMVILCPCDDPDKSNFYKFLRDVKEDWEIKEIIATSYPLGKGAVID